MIILLTYINIYTNHLFLISEKKMTNNNSEIMELDEEITAEVNIFTNSRRVYIQLPNSIYIYNYRFYFILQLNKTNIYYI